MTQIIRYKKDFIFSFKDNLQQIPEIDDYMEDIIIRINDELSKINTSIRILDKKRLIPCASLCEGEFDVNGYFIGVPTIIGCNGVERIIEFKMNDAEKEELNKTLSAVKKTVSETGL